MSVFALPFQMDLKIKGSGIGGFSDGGVKCIRRDLNDPRTFIAKPFVDVGPEPGKAWRSIALSARAASSSSVAVANFDGTQSSISVVESLVKEDGTVLGPYPSPNSIAALSIDRLLNSFFSGASLGGILSYPNKLRYAIQGAVHGRVILMLLVQELDLLKDE